MTSDTTFQKFTLPEESLGNAGDNTRESPSQAESGKTRLPAILGTRDLTVLMLLIVLFVANNNGVQFGGPSAFFYWTLGLLTFLVPCAYVTQWLAKHFPGQGAPYLWATRVLGARWSFFSAFCAWLPGVLAVVSAIETGLIFIQYLVPTWFTTPVQQGLAIVLILLVPTGLACLPLRWLSHILLVVAALYFGVFILLGIAGALWLWSGHPAATALNMPGAWQPTSGNFAVYGIVVLAFLGVDIPVFMGGEIRGGKAYARHATSYVWWGTVLSFIAYVVGTFGIMVIVPPSQSGVMAANVQAIQMIFGPLAGNIAAIVLAAGQFALTIAYILMFSRLLVVVAQDHRLPVSLTTVNRHGVPVLSIVVQAAVVAIVTILSLVIVPDFFGTLIHPNDLAFAIYNVLQAGTTVVWICSIVQLFVFILWLLYRPKIGMEVTKRQRILLIVLSFIGIIASCVGIWATVSSSWLPNLIPNERWVLLVLGVAIISLMVGWIGSELPRVHALLSEQRSVNDREVALREQLQTAYDEQEILVQQQQVLLAEVDRLYREHAQAAITDAVTGLPNHRAVISRIDEELSRCQRNEESCAILFVDLDHFKRVNDTWGHRAGDTILREVGHRLRTTLRLEDFVGRYGGEEFAAVLTNTDIYGACETAERLREVVASQPCYWEAEDVLSNVRIPVSTNIPVTASIGVAVYQLHGVTREALIEHADLAMYRAKHTGRNRVCITDTAMSSTWKGLPVADERRQSGELMAMQALTAAASAHDRGTDAHAHRMVQLAVATASVLGQSEEELHLLRLAVLLHDIGKIGIPDAILHKPGPLTDEEWMVMRRHPEIGHQILQQAGGVFGTLAGIVATHHERWDGRGYPHGLAKEDIPLTSRIISVIDAFDAMTSLRPYKGPMPVDQTKAELRRCAGSQFDPRVVETFLQVLDEEGMAEVGGTVTTTSTAIPEEATRLDQEPAHA